MRDIRLIATDLDGTLLDGTGHIRPYTRETLQECIRRGITVMFVSGRCHESARLPALETGLEIAIASSNGARIDKSQYGPTIYERLMDEKECALAWSILQDCPGNVHAYIRGTNFVRSGSGATATPEIRYAGEPSQLAEWCYDDIGRMRRESARNVHKFEVYSSDRSILDEYAARCRAAGFAVTSANDRDIEIQPADSTKGAAVLHMAHILGIGAEQVIAFGDYTNDISMLREAGIGVAMANAVAEVRAMADRIAPPNVFEGEARTIRSIVFGEKDIWPNMIR